MIADAFYDVAEYYRACETPVKHVPAFPADGRMKICVGVVDRMVNTELMGAIEHRDMVEVAENVANSIYALIGVALEFGVPLPVVWHRVHTAYMLKVDPLTHRVNRNDDGTVAKAENWQPPDIRGALVDSGWVPE
jgi:predicted HAD superfamily Cof-like phosphohydrolase